MKVKSIKQNMILNSIKIIFAILFPLITFPYASRILLSANLGKINFSNSIVSYFVLLGGLGISSYAIRNGSALKDKKKDFELFVSQMFSINMISMLLSYGLLFIFLFTSSKMQEYKILILIQSLSIFFMTIGMDWINTVYEDFLYITIQTIFFQVISIILLFVFVKTPTDYLIYSMIMVFSTVGYNVVNFFHIRKYAKVRLNFKLNFVEHFKPILLIFSTTIATTIYVNSGITILGYVTNDHYVGIYSASNKVYSIIKQVLQGVVVVTLPRLSYLYSKNSKKEFMSLIKKIYGMVLLLSLPLSLGIFLFAEDIILIISGPDFLAATESLQILSLSLIFSSFATIATTSVLLPQKKEKHILIASAISSIVNIVLNILLIPFWKHNGAAFTTLVAEILIFLISIMFAKIDIKSLFAKKDILCSFLECISILLIYTLLKNTINNSLFMMMACSFLSMISYIAILWITKNNHLLELKTKNKL